MPIEINGEIFYTASELCEKVGISRPTLFRWLKQGVIRGVRKNRRGWRIFTEEELGRIKAEREKIHLTEMS